MDGPVILPKLYNGDSATTRTVTVPTLKERVGDFTGTRAGNGRPNYRSPGLRDGDVAVFKNVSFSESRYVQLRLEAFNVTNTATFSTPHMTFGASNFGVIDSYAGGRGPRELQVAVKFYF